MKTKLIILILLFCNFVRAENNISKESINISASFLDITDSISILNVDDVIDFVLINGVYDYNYTKYLCMPSYHFNISNEIEVEAFLVPGNGSGRPCDSLQFNDLFNGIALRNWFDTKSDRVYYEIHLVRTGDLLDEDKVNIEGMEEEKVYVLYNEGENIDTIMEHTLKYFNYVSQEISKGNSSNLLNVELDQIRTYLSCSKTLTIENKQNIRNKYNLEIVNASGQRVLSQNIEFPNSYTFDLTGNPNGFYFVNLQNNKENYTQKIVLQ